MPNINLTDPEVIRERLTLLLDHVNEDQGGFRASLSPAECVEVLEGYIGLLDHAKKLRAKLDRVVSCR